MTQPKTISALSWQPEINPKWLGKMNESQVTTGLRLFCFLIEGILVAPHPGPVWANPLSLRKSFERAGLKGRRQKPRHGAPPQVLAGVLYVHALLCREGFVSQ